MLFFWQGYFELPHGFSDYYNVINREVWYLLPRHTRLIILAMLAALDE
jgi:hypothetical protein